MGYSCTKSMANTGCIGWDKTVVTTLIGSVNLKKLLCSLYRQHLCNPDIIYQTIILQLLTYPTANFFFLF